jgi:hypothetical protein
MDVSAPGKVKSENGVLTWDFLELSPTRTLEPNVYAPGFPAGAHKAVFNFMFGSYIGDWDRRNSLLRAPLGESDGFGLASAWAGDRPTWYVHKMALGGTIGESLLLTARNYAGHRDYVTPGEFGASSTVDTALMGDPTLRQDTIKPASNLIALNGAGGNQLQWQASADPAVSSYYVYRFVDNPADPDDGPETGPWAVLNGGSPVSATNYTDTGSVNTDGVYYMVRATRLETTPSGTYHNVSTGVVSRPRIASQEFDWDGHVPDAGNPWMQWIDVKFTQEVNLNASNATSLLSLFGEEYDPATRTLVPRTLVYGVDYKLIDDPAERTKRIVFLNPSNPTQPGQVRNGLWTLRVSQNAANLFGQSTGYGFDPGFDFFFLIADADHDGDVDFTDNAMLAQHYNQPTQDPEHPRLSGDFNNDGVVDFQDLSLMSQLYNHTLPS